MPTKPQAARRGILALALLLAAPAAAPAAASAAPADAAACAAAGLTATRAAGLPGNLLLAIGLVESGRADPLTGRAAPWPWSVNVDGAGRFFDSEAAAQAFVRLALASGARDVDVGCFQISLEQHPDAFGTLDEAFAPARNAAYAADLLTRLRGLTGSWAGAIEAYHSASPALGLPYERLVLAAWAGIGALPAGLGDDAAALALTDPVVIEESPAARLVRVYTMDDPAGAAPAAGDDPPDALPDAPAAPGRRTGLPRVISP